VGFDAQGDHIGTVIKDVLPVTTPITLVKKNTAIKT
jgi:hypothetical protein